MNTTDISTLLDYGRKKYPLLRMKEIDVKDLVYEERVKMSCFYCSRYGSNWRCPPRIPEVDYRKMLSEYDHAAFVWVDMPFTGQTYTDVRSESSVTLHRALLDLEEYLLEQGASLTLSFIGGSCKLCKNGCGKDKCNNPYQSRSPLEATGVNVVKSAAKYGIRITFPVTDHLIRMGLLLW